MDKPVDLQAKSEWCRYGEQKEADFAAYCFDKGISVMRNTTKVVDKYAADLMTLLPADLKSVNTPFFTAKRYGFDPAHTITLNVKDVVHYGQRHPAMLLFFDISWDAQEKFGIAVPAVKTLRVCFLPSILLWVESGRAAIHEYIERKDDSNGNAKASYLLDFTWFREL